ncbi:hypothetical protein [Janthinobacterium sp.]|uniref:hypothetical protein n=1 Tax=Janthinobacterium sp. TaxID=1871054 RepID=UPI00293D363D|nr:hypothetical protein [Janthinobacterium sp.]
MSVVVPLSLVPLTMLLLRAQVSLVSPLANAVEPDRYAVVAAGQPASQALATPFLWLAHVIVRLLAVL